MKHLLGKEKGGPPPETGMGLAPAEEVLPTEPETGPDLERRRRQALQGLLAELGAAKAAARDARRTVDLDETRRQLDLAEERLALAERLQSASREELSAESWREVLTRYSKPPKPETEKAESADQVLELSARTPEGREIKFDLRERLKYWGDFYRERGVDWVSLPESIGITEEQAREMRALMEQGFNHLVIIPEGLVGSAGVEEVGGEKKVKPAANYPRLHQLMSQGYNETWQSDNYKSDGGLEGAADRTTKLRIILTKDVQNLADDPLLAGTRGKSIEALETDELKKYVGLSEAEYLVIQREYFQRTDQHLDEKGATWLPSSRRPLSGRVPCAGWGPDGSQLRFVSAGRDDQNVDLGCRLAGSFEV